ncbi:MAG: DUF711 family protein [Chloroflexi bacterium AL-W]|nr:DUF711 family protein [Chloroflexi bacterium AL-N1]NOK70087.1 DUF711 family protein [Chloroflexi bacterium AL-N10]NOK77901.1 DUF711 family protein [Chloroflexi bacterium AL-N5]NOK84910.1 DUF711 family protein [Chloroflexi bacterium AL-W]NOK91889.1 DUF711 family protein [Chloroflexi bacterium AL-N15]
MQIRTITAGAREAAVSRVAKAVELTRSRLEEAGYTVQTMRLALTQVANTCADVATVVAGAEQLALDAGFDYVSIGQLESRRLPELAEAFAATDTVFASANIAGPDGSVRYDTIRAAAEAIVQIGATTPQGFGNLCFAASACVAPGSPFFPAAYHNGDDPWIAIGPEASVLAVEAVQTAHDPDAGTFVDVPRDAQIPLTGSSTASPRMISALARLTALIEEHDARIVAAVRSGPPYIEHDVNFPGCDWSLAPHPAPERSIGLAIEALSGVPFGAWGTLAAIRGLTSAIRAAQVPQVGFSGVMLPVLEDTTLADRNNTGPNGEHSAYYTLRDLLAFSAVCGTGLDTIPLPGNTTADQIAGILTEVAALASTLRKPLTARLLPIPGLQAGERTTFDFPYFVNTRVMQI